MTITKSSNWVRYKVAEAVWKLKYPLVLPSLYRNVRCVFDYRLHKDDGFLCNAMINAHSSIHQYVESFTLYRDFMREMNFTLDKYTFTSLAKCCTLNMAVREDEEIHSNVLKSGVYSNLYVSTTLLDMYVKFGTIRCARELFDEMTKRSEVSWTSLIVGYAKFGNIDEAQKHFDEMPNKDTTAFNAMIHGYVKLCSMDLAQDLFNRMPNKDVISWTSMISGYCHIGEDECKV